MSTHETLGGTFTLPGTSITVHRMGYGAMQLAGPHVFGPPRDREAALAVLRAAIAAGVDHIDTSDFYGPHVTNQIIREALAPYPENLTLVTKVGARRGDDGSWIIDSSAEWLRTSVEDNLRNLGLDTLPVVNFRTGFNGGLGAPTDDSIAEPISVLLELQQQGLVQHIGLSHVSPAQYSEAKRMGVNAVCVQNMYNIAHREDDAFVQQLQAEGVAYVPYFPLGGFTPLQSSALNDVAAELGATPMAVAQAWLLQRSPNILLIPGTSSVEHLKENIAAASLELDPTAVAKLDGIGAKS